MGSRSGRYQNSSRNLRDVYRKICEDCEITAEVIFDYRILPEVRTKNDKKAETVDAVANLVALVIDYRQMGGRTQGSFCGARHLVTRESFFVFHHHSFNSPSYCTVLFNALMDRPSTSKPRGVCKYYLEPRGCFAGDRCKFLHCNPDEETAVTLTPYDQAKKCRFYAKGTLSLGWCAVMT